MLSRLVEGFFFILIITFLLGVGGAGTVVAGRAVVGSLAVWTWEGRQCWVEDFRVIEGEKWLGIHYRGQTELVFDVRDAENGVFYEGASITSVGAEGSEPEHLHRHVGPRTPGALIDCWVAGDGVTAIVQRDSWWLIAIEIAELMLMLVLFAGGVIGIKPSLMDKALDAIEPWVLKWGSVLRRL